jgi:hypothetical protein
MSKWDYAQIVISWSCTDKGDFIKDAYLSYLKPSGSSIERPIPEEEEVKGLFGKPQMSKKPINYWEWHTLKIAELGQNGWEMISAPGVKLTGAGNQMSGGYSWTDKWVFWFKRPSV